MTKDLAETCDSRRQAVALEIQAGVPWSLFIECKNEDPATFDPKITGEKPAHYEERRQAASAICARCPVIEQCLEEAYRLKDLDTYRGGMTGDERLAAAKRSQGAAIRLRRAS